MNIKLNLDMNGKKKGDIVNLKVQDGIVLDRYWRRRIHDAEIDKCLTVLEDKKIIEEKKVVQRNRVFKNKEELENK